MDANICQFYLDNVDKIESVFSDHLDHLELKYLRHLAGMNYDNALVNQLDKIFWMGIIDIPYDSTTDPCTVQGYLENVINYGK